MHWMNPAGAWAFTAMAAILALYILKQRMEPFEVSSTYLWDQVLASLETDRPLQRIKGNILLILQLIITALLALSLMQPMRLGTQAEEVLFIFDGSASMQAVGEEGTSRLEKAVEDAKRRVGGLSKEARVSILVAGPAVRQPLTRSNDINAARRALDLVKGENGTADLPGALSLADALSRELPGLSVVLYSDQPLETEGMLRPALGPGLSNCAILSLHGGEREAVARIANYGGATDITLECYGDGELADVRAISLSPGELASVSFALPSPANEVWVVIAEGDALPLDNERTWVRREKSQTLVVLAGRENIFVEKALGLREDVLLVKTTAEEAGILEDAALIVMDGPLPAEMPRSGALFLIDPDGGVGPLREAPATLSAAAGSMAEALNAHLDVGAIQVGRYRPVLSGTPIWMAGEDVVLTIERVGGRHIATLGFDLHEANLPLLKEFPIFMQQLLDILAPQPLGNGFEGGDCGAVLPIALPATVAWAKVLTPTGREVPLSLPGATLTDTGEIGAYTLVAGDEKGGETRVPFTLHMPVGESDVRTAPPTALGNEGSGSMAFGRAWTPWLLSLLLCLLLLEWGVYRRGI